jgi:hypothetical protein
MLRNSRWRYRRRACSAGHSDSEGAATIAPPPAAYPCGSPAEKAWGIQ